MHSNEQTWVETFWLSIYYSLEFVQHSMIIYYRYMVVWGPQRNRYKRYLKESPLAIQNWIIGLMLPISSDREESKVLILSSFIVLRYILSCMCFIPRINDQPWRWIKLWITHTNRYISLFANISSFISFHKYFIIYKLSL